MNTVHCLPLNKSNHNSIGVGKRLARKKWRMPWENSACFKNGLKILSNWNQIEGTNNLLLPEPNLCLLGKDSILKRAFKSCFSSKCKNICSNHSYPNAKTLPVSFQYPLSNGITYLVEHNFIVSATYEKLVLQERESSCKSFLSL